MYGDWPVRTEMCQLKLMFQVFPWGFFCRWDMDWCPFKGRVSLHVFLLKKISEFVFCFFSTGLKAAAPACHHADPANAKGRTGEEAEERAAKEGVDGVSSSLGCESLGSVKLDSSYLKRKKTTYLNYIHPKTNGWIPQNDGLFVKGIGKIWPFWVSMLVGLGVYFPQTNLWNESIPRITLKGWKKWWVYFHLFLVMFEGDTHPSIVKS